MTERLKNFIEAARQLRGAPPGKGSAEYRGSKLVTRLIVFGILAAAIAVYLYKHLIGAP